MSFFRKQLSHPLKLKRRVGVGITVVVGITAVFFSSPKKNNKCTFNNKKNF